MTPAQTILLFILAMNTIVATAVFLTNAKRSQNRFFILFSTSLSIWVIFVLGIINATSQKDAFVGIRGASIAGASIPVTFYLFCQAIACPSLSFKELCKKSRIILIWSILLGGMCLTDLFLNDVIMPNEGNHLKVPDARYNNIGFALFISFFPIVICRTMYIFYRTLRSSFGMARTEMQFTLVGMASALPVAVIVHVIAIFSGSSEPQQYGPLCIIPMNLVIAYGIATRRILGIEHIIRKIISYLIMASFLAVVYYSTLVSFRFLLSEFLPDPSTVSQISATILSILSLSIVQHRIDTAANKLISTKSMDIAATMKRASVVFQSVNTVSSLTELFTKLIKESLDCESRLVFIRNNQAYTPNMPDVSQIEFAHDNPIVETLKLSKDTICKDTLERSRQTKNTILVKAEMDRHGFVTATGIFSKGILIGILLTHQKADGGIYDKREQDALQILCNQFAVALENAQLYTEAQNSKIRNEIMLDQLVSGVILANPEKEITLFNHEAQRITGLRDALGNPIDILPKPIAIALDKALSQKKGERNVDARLFEQDETEKCLSIRMGTTFLLGHDQKPMGALMVFTDMTELKSLEEQVRRSDQLSSVGTLAAGMAHEIKNPLVTIKTFTQLLPQRYEDRDFRDEFSSLVAHEVARIDTIVNELLKFSKPTKPHLIPMHLHDLISQTLKITHEQMVQKEIEINDACLASRDLIQGDGKLLFQALLNLLLNGIEAIEQGGAITVGTTNCTHRFANSAGTGKALKKECIRVHISDTGQGIPPENMKKIFDPFFTSKSEGTGMGLSVAHGIIQEHHGTIEVESEPGIGSTFYIYLPTIDEKELE